MHKGWAVWAHPIYIKLSFRVHTIKHSFFITFVTFLERKVTQKTSWQVLHK